MDEGELAARIAADQQRSLDQSERLAWTLLRRIEAIHQRNLSSGLDVPPEINVLLLSSGGQYGAFGTGVLHGWSESPSAEFKRPNFDVVTGVSTGALIAPFAISGEDDSIRRVGDLFQQADDSFARLRGVLFFLPWRSSIFDTSVLRKRVQSEIDADVIERVAAAYDEHRLLLVGAVNLDLGRFHIWDMGSLAIQARQTNDPAPFHDALISSSAIPGAFPPIEIDRVLYTDGAVALPTFLGLDRQMVGQVVRAFRERNPGAPTPDLRIWMIVNGHINPIPQLAGQGWASVALRSAQVISRYSLRTNLRLMQIAAELIGEDIGSPVEFRYIAVPPDVELPESDSRLFDQDLMFELHQLGYRLGTDPDAWQTEAIAPDIPGTSPTRRRIPFETFDAPGPQEP
jgi:predicted acylesterase/phospholipase RssA